MSLGFKRLNWAHKLRDEVGLCYHSMARSQVVDSGTNLQTWTVAANILNKQSRTADKGWTSSLGVG